MAKLEKKGHNIDIKNIVIHKVIKDAGERRVKIEPASSVINIGEKEKIFIADLHSAYYKKSSPVYGVFGNDNPDFKVNLRIYVGESDSLPFLDFTKTTTEIYKREIQKSAPATGGFLIFADYVNTDSNINYLLVLTTNNKDGFAINDKLEIEGIQSIDMSKVDVACLINITKFKKIEADSETDDTYLSFVRGNKDISVYFMTFIDCNDKTTSKVSSVRLLQTIDDYMKTKGWDYETKRQKKNDIFAYCDKCMSNKEGIKLSTISDLINSEDANEFSEFASEENRGVSSVISGMRSELKKLKTIYYKDKFMTLGFDRELLTTNQISYNADRKSLTFKGIPQELIDQIIK